MARILVSLILLFMSSAPFAGSARTASADAGGQQRVIMPPRSRSAAEPAKGTAAISGVVTDAETGTPLRRARVSVNGEALRGGGRWALTDNDGRFAIGELPAGTYMLFASKGGYVETRFGGRARRAEARSITLAEGQKLEDVDVALERGGVITGLVTDEVGEPMVDVNVQVLQLRWFNGRRRPLPSQRPASTNDRGEFRIWGLPPGQYIVAASMDQFSFGPDGGAQKSGYTPTYFPGTPALDQAQLVTVSAGQESAGVSFALSPSRTVRISGLALGLDGKPMTEGGVMVMPRGEDIGPWTLGGVMGGSIGADGRFTVTGVPPGEYTIQARTFDRATREPGPAASAIVTAGTEDIDNLVLVATRGARITGRLTFEPGLPAEARERITVMAPPLDAGGFGRIGGRSEGRVGDEGSFELTDLQPGRYGLMVMDLPAGWEVKHVHTAAGVDVTDSGIDVGKEDVTGLEVRVTNRQTTVVGSVRDERGQPAGSYVALLFSQDEAHWQQIGQRRMNVGRPDQNGVYRVRGLAPGAYYAVAIPELPEEWGNPELMRRMASAAEEFTLAEGESKTLDLVLRAWDE